MEHGWEILKRTAGAWLADNAFKHSAALAFYTLFSMAPIAILAVAVAGAVLGDATAREELASVLRQVMGPDAARALHSAAERARPDQGAWWSTLLGVLLLVTAASTVFVQLQQSLNQIWRVTSKPSRSGFKVFLKTRLLSLALVLTIGFLLLVSLFASAAITALIRFAESVIPLPGAVLKAADLTVSLIVVTLLFALIFRILPDVKIAWRDVWKGALLTAVLFLVGRFIISSYLAYSSTASIYGAAGSLVVILLWVYYSSLILFFGVEFTRVRLEVLGIPVRTKDTAVRVRREIIEEE